jgi:hypothetical protein
MPREIPDAATCADGRSRLQTVYENLPSYDWRFKSAMNCGEKVVTSSGFDIVQGITCGFA